MRTCFFFQAEDGIRDVAVTGVQTCALPILRPGIWKGSPSKHEPEDRRAPAGRALRLLQARQRLAAAVRRTPGELEDRVREIIESFAGRLLLRPYGLVGIRGDCDFLLWQVAENLDALVALQTALNRTDLGAYLT